MISLSELAKGQKSNEPPTLRQAHFVEEHFVLPKSSWGEAAALLPQLFPREARAERPSRWYLMLRGTHWPADPRLQQAAQVPPGNGPFYIPSWVIDDLPEERRKEIEQALKGAKFKKVWAQAVYLPPHRNYLVSIMRAAGAFLWNADPLMYRGYFYPSLGAQPRAQLRDYNVERWRL